MGTLGDMASDPLGDETQFGDEMQTDNLGNPVNNNNMIQMNPNLQNPNLDNLAPEDSVADGAQADETLADEQQADETQADETQADETQDDEGSGGGTGGFFDGFPSFSFPSFFRSFTGRQGRQSRQLTSPCTDRITLPCIVEDFLGMGMGDIPTCIPVHCGSSLCQAGVASCKIETSVTPFHIGVHFGEGKTNKGSPEDNIGACLRYKQLPCS
jgi:ribosomal protein L12E/L44/L45/RPP1/RPP2